MIPFLFLIDRGCEGGKNERYVYTGWGMDDLKQQTCHAPPRWSSLKWSSFRLSVYGQAWRCLREAGQEARQAGAGLTACGILTPFQRQIKCIHFFHPRSDSQSQEGWQEAQRELQHFEGGMRLAKPPFSLWRERGRLRVRLCTSIYFSIIQN